MDIQKLVSDELTWLARQEKPVATKMVDIYQQSFLEIEQQLAGIKDLNSYTAHQLRATQAQLGALIDGMHEQHSQLLGGHVKSVYRKQMARDGKTWSRLEEAFGDPKLAAQFKDIAPAFNQRAIRSLVTTQNISIKGFSSDLQRQVREVIAISHAKGESPSKAVSRLRRIQGLPSCSPNRLRLIVRMETARSTNKAKLDHIKELQRQFPDREYWLMVKDRIDRTKKTRNHWLSWAISNTVRCVTRGEYYEVSTAVLNAAKAEYKQKTGRKASDNGVLWKSGGVGRKGKGLPAHFWDRGVEVPWDPSWSGGAFGEVKHPQGPIIIHVEPLPPEPKALLPAPEPTPEPAAAPDVPAQVEPPKPSAKERVRKRRLGRFAFQQPDNPLEYKPLRYESDFPEYILKYQKKDLASRVFKRRPRSKSLWKFEKEIVNEPIEHLRIFDALGRVRHKSIGDAVSVGFNFPEIAPYRCMSLTHNHPKPVSFSIEDLIHSIICNFKETRVVTDDGTGQFALSIERLGTHWSKPQIEGFGSDWRWNIQDLEKLHRMYFDFQKEKALELISQNAHPDEVSWASSHYATQKICELMNVEYRVFGFR